MLLYWTVSILIIILMVTAYILISESIDSYNNPFIVLMSIPIPLIFIIAISGFNFNKTYIKADNLNIVKTKNRVIVEYKNNFKTYDDVKSYNEINDSTIFYYKISRNAFNFPCTSLVLFNDTEMK